MIGDMLGVHDCMHVCDFAYFFFSNVYIAKH